MAATVISLSSETRTDAFTTGLPSTLTRPSAMSRAACVRERASPRDVTAASRRWSGMLLRHVLTLENLGELAVQARVGVGSLLERTLFDQPQSGDQGVIRVVSHPSTVPPPCDEAGQGAGDADVVQLYSSSGTSRA